MAGTLYINNETVWMPAGWVFDGAMELIDAELKVLGAARGAALLAARTEAGGVCDLRGLNAEQFQLLAQAAARVYERLVAEGPGAFYKPAFYQGFVAQIAKLRGLLSDAASKGDQMEINKLSNNEFYSMSQLRRIITHEHPRRFAAIDLGKQQGVYGLSWRSDKIEPVVKVAAERFLWVGVDQGLAAIDLKTGEVRLSLSLNSNLLQILVEEKLVIVLTETEAIVFNSNLSIRFIKGLPDLPDSLSISNNQVSIRLIDGQPVVFSVDSGFSLSRAA